MAKSETPGFMSKVVRFVRNPGVAWSDGGTPDEDADSGYSKQLLKEVVERRRHNDFVRKREFDQLRRLRRRGTAAEQPSDGQVSFFATSLLSRPDDRAVTLRKIDEIEEQMSQQWWKTRPPEPGDLPSRVVPPGEPGLYAHRPRASSRDGRVRAASDPMPLPSPAGAGALKVDIELPDAGMDVSGTARPPEPVPLMPPMVLQPAVEELPGFVHDPQIEDAAIRFANADYAGAESTLRLLATEDGGASEQAWAALFDLYRCIDRHAHFEAAALEFAQRFGRSPPSWYLVCPPGMAAPARAQDDFRWQSLAHADGLAVEALEEALTDAATPWLLDWSALQGFHDDAVLPLLAAFSRWGDMRVPIRMAGVEALLSGLQARTPSGDALVDPIWWRLHMEVLRVLGQPDAFELVALDYCVTYEVSPPSWHPARCECRAVDPQADDADALLESDRRVTAAVPAPVADLRGTGFGGHFPVLTQTLLPTAPVAELAGEITGDADAAMARLDAAAEHVAGTVVVACDRLVRMDFSAAGSVLNWAAAQDAAGRRVQFRNLHRLTATFLNLIGVDEYARVHVRSD